MRGVKRGLEIMRNFISYKASNISQANSSRHGESSSALGSPIPKPKKPNLLTLSNKLSHKLSTHIRMLINKPVVPYNR